MSTSLFPSDLTPLHPVNSYLCFETNSTVALSGILPLLSSSPGLFAALPTFLTQCPLLFVLLYKSYSAPFVFVYLFTWKYLPIFYLAFHFLYQTECLIICSQSVHFEWINEWIISFQKSGELVVVICQSFWGGGAAMFLQLVKIVGSRFQKHFAKSLIY